MSSKISYRLLIFLAAVIFSAIFAALNLNTKLCVPKICGKYARGGEGKGAQVLLSAGQTQVGALFVTK